MAVIVGGKNPGHKRESIVPYFRELLSTIPSSVEELHLHDVSCGTLDRFCVLIVATSLESAGEQVLCSLQAFSGKPRSVSVYLHEASIYDERANRFFLDFLGVRFGSHQPYGIMEVRTCSHHFTRGVAKVFTTTDESYAYRSVSGDFPRDSFLFSSEGIPLGFATLIPSSEGRVVYIALGHDTASIQNNGFRTILRNVVT